METDDLATFRSKYPSVADALAHCERPDWAIQLTFDGTSDRRKDVIRHAANAARNLTSTFHRRTTRLFKPWPGPLEAVNIWAGNADASFERTRATALGTLVAALGTYIGDYFVTGSNRGVLHLPVTLAVFAISSVVLATGFRLILSWVVRRRVARLDENAALKIVLDVVRKGMAKRPERVRVTVGTLSRKFTQLLET